MTPSQSVCGLCGGLVGPVDHDVTVTTLTPPPVDVQSVVDATIPPEQRPERTAPPDDPTSAVTSPPPSAADAPTVAGGLAGGGPFPLTPPVAATLQPGTRFGRRYHLIRSLGEGGMGAVYQAWDEELAVVVAIKVIRPETLKDAVAVRDLERRFKRELLLARNVTHKNVVRIHDLGEVNGIKYITMPYVHGSDLAKVLKREGRLPVPRALAIARQIAAGLVAAHEAGIVHRDLKPGNILLDEEDHALITDFGIARSVTGPGGGTIAGTVVGTLEYMAPEQAQGVTVDHRADIYAFGLIVSDMLIGRRQAAHTESAMGELFERMMKAPPSLRTVDATIPDALDAIVSRCVDPDPARRYQTTHDLVAALDEFSGDRHATASARLTMGAPVAVTVPAAPQPAVAPVLPRRAPSRRWLAGTAMAVIIALGAVGFLVRDRVDWRSPATSASDPARSSSLFILPFRNASGDSSLDWLGPTAANMLRTEVGQSASLRTVSGDRVAQLLVDMRIAPDATMDPATLTRLARLGSADTALWGQYVKFGTEIRIDATLQDVTGNRTISLKAEAAGESDLPDAIQRLAGSVRENLSLSPSVIKELAASAFKPSSHSVQALRYYTEGLELARRGTHLDAVKKFRAATDEDPQFALAYSKLAESYSALGHSNDAETYSGKAVGLSEGLPSQEKYLILANRARIRHDDAKAIEYYETLHKAMPGDDDVLYSLATLYENAGAYDKARAGFAQLLSRDPKYIDALLGAGRVEIRSGKAEDALDYLTRAQTLAVQRGNDEARASILRALGVNYRVLNKPADALRHYLESLEIERRLGRTLGIADSLHTIAQIQDEAGDSDQALKNYLEALELRRPLGDRQGIGDVLNDLGNFYAARGRYSEALAQFKEALQMQREVRNQAFEAVALNNIGTMYLSLGSYDEATTYLQQAVTIRERINAPSEMADTLHNLAEVSVKTGAFETALGQYLKALDVRRQVGDKRAAAIELYNLGTLFEYQGRYGAAVQSKAEAVKIFRELNDRGVWLPKVLAAYGSALAQAGRFEEARRLLGEALPIARALKNDELIAQIVTSQGDVFYYQGDFGSARREYQVADTLVTRAKLQQEKISSQLNLAKIAMKDGKSPVRAEMLSHLGATAERQGLKFESAEYSLLAGESELRSKRYAQARVQLDATVARAEQLGARTLLAQAHQLLAVAHAANGEQAEARRHSTRAGQLLEAIRKDAREKDAREDHILQRSDLKPILQDTVR